MALATELFLLQASYQFFDVYLISHIAVLRGYNDTKNIFGSSIISYSGIGLPLVYILARTALLHPAMGVADFLAALLVALLVGGLLSTLRILYLYRKTAETSTSMIRN